MMDSPNRFLNDAGIARYKAITDVIKSVLPRALVGANYSPTGYAIGPSSSSVCHAYLLRPTIVLSVSPHERNIDGTHWNSPTFLLRAHLHEG